jgi:Tol biopolymer transport system component
MDTSVELDPVFSGDGSQIIFAYGDGTSINIGKVNVNGSGFTSLTNDSAFDWFPTWSWETGMVAFETNRFASDFSDFDIVVMNADGSNQTRITYTTTNDSFPDWSPDGTMLVFVSNADGTFQLYIMNADGSNIHNVTNNGYDNGAPAWQP